MPISHLRIVQKLKGQMPRLITEDLAQFRGCCSWSRKPEALATRLERRESACVHGQARAPRRHAREVEAAEAAASGSLVGFGEVTWTNHGPMALADSIAEVPIGTRLFQRDPQQQGSGRGAISDVMPQAPIAPARRAPRAGAVVPSCR